MLIGAQLFTLKRQCKTLPELEEALRKVSEIGYTTVQLSGVCEYTPAWMAEKLAKYSLKAPLTHFPYQRIVEDTDATVEFHRAFGAEYIGLGSLPNFRRLGLEAEVWDKFIREIPPALEKIHSSGLKFCYHHHNPEFAKMPDGGLYIDALCSRFLAEKFGITLDTYWVQAGGGDPAWWINKLRGRLECIHLKDMAFSTEDNAPRFAPVGQGNLNWDAILEAAEAAGTRYAFVEQDNCYGRDPFECLAESYAFLTKKGLK